MGGAALVPIAVRLQDRGEGVERRGVCCRPFAQLVADVGLVDGMEYGNWGFFQGHGRAERVLSLLPTAMCAEDIFSLCCKERSDTWRTNAVSLSRHDRPAGTAFHSLHVLSCRVCAFMWGCQNRLDSIAGFCSSAAFWCTLSAGAFLLVFHGLRYPFRGCAEVASPCAIDCSDPHLEHACLERFV